MIKFGGQRSKVNVTLIKDNNKNTTLLNYLNVLTLSSVNQTYEWLLVFNSQTLWVGFDEVKPDEVCGC